MTTTTICPKCRNKGDSPNSCTSCGTNYAAYEKDKQGAVAKVYALIQNGDFAKAKIEAEKLPKDFPDGQGEFALLLSNINRDINIQGKYNEALEFFTQGKFDQVGLILRNIRAFDPTLEEKIITLRKKALRHNAHQDMLNEAIEKFTSGRFGQAQQIFQTIHDTENQELIHPYLGKITKKKDGLFKQAVKCLQSNLFEAAEQNFERLHNEFPETRERTKVYTDLLKNKKNIQEKLLAAAQNAKEENRPFEAKVLYAFMCWQHPEFRPRLASYLDETLEQQNVTLADLTREKKYDFATDGLQLDEDGLFTASTREKQTGLKRATDQEGLFIPLPESPDPSPDTTGKQLDLAKQQCADFSC